MTSNTILIQILQSRPSRVDLSIVTIAIVQIQVRAAFCAQPFAIFLAEKLLRQIEQDLLPCYRNRVDLASIDRVELHILGMKLKARFAAELLFRSEFEIKLDIDRSLKGQQTSVAIDLNGSGQSADEPDDTRGLDRPADKPDVRNDPGVWQFKVDDFGRERFIDRFLPFKAVQIDDHFNSTKRPESRSQGQTLYYIGWTAIVNQSADSSGVSNTAADGLVNSRKSAFLQDLGQPEVHIPGKRRPAIDESGVCLNQRGPCRDLFESVVTRKNAADADDRKSSFRVSIDRLDNLIRLLPERFSAKSSHTDRVDTRGGQSLSADRRIGRDDPGDTVIRTNIYRRLDLRFGKVWSNLYNQRNPVIGSFGKGREQLFKIFGFLKFPQIQRIRRRNVDRNVIGVRCEQFKASEIILRRFLDRNVLVLADVHPDDALPLEFRESFCNRNSTFIIKPEPIDECLIFRKSEHSRLWISGLRVMGNSSDFDKSEPERCKWIDGNRVLIKPCGDTDRIRKPQTESTDGLDTKTRGIGIIRCCQAGSQGPYTQLVCGFRIEPEHRSPRQFFPKNPHTEMLDIRLSSLFSEARATSFDIRQVFATICSRMADEAKLVEKSRIMDGTRMERALSRLATEIVEANHGAANIYLVGIRRRGVPLAERLRDKIEALEGTRPLYGIIDITLYRDDLSTVGANPIVNRTELAEDIDGKCIVLVDDVLYTGRTIRAALDQLMDFGRPKKVQLAVLIDRGREHRELPIQADFIGKVVPTKQTEIIKVMLQEFDDTEAVGIFERPSE